MLLYRTPYSDCTTVDRGCIGRVTEHKCFVEPFELCSIHLTTMNLTAMQCLTVRGCGRRWAVTMPRAWHGRRLQ